MKCIKCIKVAKSYQLDEIRRVTDEDADDRVKGGYWKFVPKSEWKSATRKPKSVQVIEQPTEEVVELSIEEKRLARKKKNK